MVRLIMKESNLIYKVITLNVRSDKWYDFSSELAAWYYYLEDAISCVENNACDIQDHAYNYALISSSREGCYGLDDKELYWYKWNKEQEKWIQIPLEERPECCNNLLITQ